MFVNTSDMSVGNQAGGGLQSLYPRSRRRISKFKACLGNRVNSRSAWKKDTEDWVCSSALWHIPRMCKGPGVQSLVLQEGGRERKEES